MAQVDYFLKIDGVDAESADQTHKGEIALESFSWGQSQSGTAGRGGGGGAGKVQSQDFSFVKKVDKSSPVLMIACATGQHYTNAILTARKAGGGQQDYLKCIVRDKIGSFKERDEMHRWLNKWIRNYVDGDPKNSSETTKAEKPLAAAEVVVEEVEGNPGYYSSKFFLRPHYQLEGLTVSLRLVSKLPSVKGGS